MKIDSNLNKFMNDKGHWSFEFYSLCPLKTKTVKKYGNFEFLMIQENNCALELYVRYVGKDTKFNWLNDSIRTNSNYSYYRQAGATKTFNEQSWCQLDKSWNSVNKNKTYTAASIVHYIEEAKRFRENANYSVKYNFGSEAEIKLFKKEVKKDKANWEQIKKEAVETTFGIPYDEYLKDQVQIDDSEATKFILKIAPMLTRLKDECTLILDNLNEPNGPSKQAKEDFITAYNKFQWHYNNRTFLTALKNFKNKKGRSKKK